MPKTCAPSLDRSSLSRPEQSKNGYCLQKVTAGHVFIRVLYRISVLYSRCNTSTTWARLDKKGTCYPPLSTPTQDANIEFLERDKYDTPMDKDRSTTYTCIENILARRSTDNTHTSRHKHEGVSFKSSTLYQEEKQITRQSQANSMCDFRG